MLKKFRIVVKLQACLKTTTSTKMVSSTVYCMSFCAALLSVVFAVSVNECSQGGLVPEKVYIDGCDSDEPICLVKFNGILNITMMFKAPHYLESMQPNLMGSSLLGTFNFTGKSSNHDVCSDILNTMCPIVEKELIKYRFSAPLLVMPLLSVKMEFSILDTQLNETAVCFNWIVSPTF